jgi:hypothetical protein
MTTVNWERISGETVEDLVAALVVMSNPNANQITPAGGDGGVDIRVATPDGFDVYQVKRYARPLTTTQAKAVERSWVTFVAKTLNEVPVASWTLVAPWNPSRQRLTWLNDLTGAAGIPTRWMGRTQLDVLAGENPRVVDYYLGNGADRIHALMAEALSAGRNVDRTSGDTLLDSVIARQRSLTDSLDDVDPFYRYETTVRAGVPDDDSWMPEHDHPSGASLITYQQLDEASFAETRIYPRSPLSHILRPIRTTMHFDVADSADAEAVRRFHLYGAPFDRVPATRIRSVGPPGTVSDGSGFVTVMPVPGIASTLPELELRLLDASGTAIHRVELVDVEYSSGLVGNGVRLAAWDASHSLKVELFVGAAGERDSLNLANAEIVGKRPAEILPAIKLGAVLDDGAELAIAIRNGKVLFGGWQCRGALGDPQQNKLWLKFIEALIEIQSHTFANVLVPREFARSAYEAVLRLARLLRGEVIEEPWDHFPMVVNKPEHIRTEPEFAILAQQPMSLNLDGTIIELDHLLQTHMPTARLDVASLDGQIKAGDTIQIRPGSDATATVRAIPAPR